MYEREIARRLAAARQAAAAQQAATQPVSVPQPVPEAQAAAAQAMSEAQQAAAQPVPAVSAQQGIEIAEVLESKDLSEMTSATCYAFSPDGLFLAVGYSGGSLDISSGKFSQFPPPPRAVNVGYSSLTSCAWSRDAQSLLITDGDSNVLSYRFGVAGNPVRNVIQKAYGLPITACAWAEAQSLFIIGSSNAVKSWSIDRQGSFNCQFTAGLTGSVSCCAYRPGGSFVAIATLSSSKFQFPSSFGSPSLGLNILGTLQNKWVTFTSSLFPTGSLDTILLSCAWSPNGQFLAGCTRSGIIYIWEFIQFVGFHDPKLAFVKAVRLPESLPIVACVWTSENTISLVAHRKGEGVAKVLSISLNM